MPKVTDIQQQVKNKTRYSIYIDEKYVCSFSDSELLNLKLHIGQEFTNTEIKQLKKDSDLDKAYARTLDLLARRPRSEWELRDYMRRKGYNEETQEEIIKKLNNLGYIDDLDFARRWVDSRRLLKSTSKRKLRQELIAKHVPDELIDQVLSEDDTDELVVLRELIERKKSKYPDKQKLMQYLGRQGFSYGDIKDALDS